MDQIKAYCTSFGFRRDIQSVAAERPHNQRLRIFFFFSIAFKTHEPGSSIFPLFNHIFERSLECGPIE